MDTQQVTQGGMEGRSRKSHVGQYLWKKGEQEQHTVGENKKTGERNAEQWGEAETTQGENAAEPVLMERAARKTRHCQGQPRAESETFADCIFSRQFLRCSCK
jgi:hypothetical protein